MIGVTIRIFNKQHKAIKNLNNTLSRNNSADRITIEVREINSYVRIIAYIAIAFCLGVAIHYMAIALPRIYEYKKTTNELQNFGVDYLGLIVAIFAIIVTLLVTWNIYSTIKAKEELRLTKEDIEKRFEERLKSFDDCCEQRKKEIAELKTENEVIKQDIAQTNKLIINLRANMLRFMGITWSAKLLELKNTTVFNNMISTYINSIKEYMQNGEIDKANLVLSYMLDDAREVAQKVSLTLKQKKNAKIKFIGISGYDNLDKAEEFIAFISSIPNA